MPKSRISNVANMSFYAIRENKILAKISEFTVFRSSFVLLECALILMTSTTETYC